MYTHTQVSGRAILPAAALLEAAIAAHMACAPAATNTAGPSLAQSMQKRSHAAGSPSAPAVPLLHALQGVAIQSPLMLGRGPQQVGCLKGVVAYLLLWYYIAQE